MAQRVAVQPELRPSWVAEEERLTVLQRSRLLDWPAEPEFDRWTAGLLRETGAAVAAFVLVDATRVVVKSLSTVDGPATETAELSLSAPLADFLIARAGLPGCTATPAYAETPVEVDSQLLGWMAIADVPGRAWSESHRQDLDDAAAAASTALSLRLAYQAAARLREHAASLNRLHELIAQAAPLSEVLTELVAGIERYEPSVIPCVVLLDGETNTLHPGAGPSLPPHFLALIDGVVIGPNVGSCGSAAWSGELTITVDIAADPRWAPIREIAVGAGLRHCWSMPIKAPDDEVLGTLAFYGPQPRHPLPEHLALMRDGARLAGIAIERHRTMEALIHDARHDALTGLPNRAAVFAYLDDALASIGPGSRVAVLFVDLDGLKTLNDTLGHDRADEMIRAVGERLSATVRTDELVGRFGGDEFVVIASRVGSDQEAVKISSRLLDAISAPLLESNRPSSPPAWESRWSPPQPQTRARRSARPTARCMRPSAREPAGAASSPAANACVSGDASRWRTSCATRRCAARCISCSSLCSILPARRSPPSRRCCAGPPRHSVRSRRASSSPSPRTRGRSSRSEPGCCVRAARRSRRSSSRRAARWSLR